jgi:hypothetical protein
MTTAVEIKRWTRPIWQHRNDLAFLDRAVFLVPINHVVRAITFEGSSDKTDPRPLWHILLPFAPHRLPKRIWSGSFPVGRSTDAGFAERLVHQIRTKIDHELMPISSIEAFYDLTSLDRKHEAPAGLWKLDKNVAHHAVVLAALGQLDKVADLALEAAETMEPIWKAHLDYWQRLATRAPNNKENQRTVADLVRRLEMYGELRRLAALAQAGDRAGIAELLHWWEARTVKAWHIEELWQPSPFPIELGAGD